MRVDVKSLYYVAPFQPIKWILRSSKCSICDNTIYETLLRNHMRENHSEIPDNNEGDGSVFEEEKDKDNRSSIDNAPPVICGQCGLTFSAEEQCNEHLASHKIRCYKCDFESVSKDEVARHEKNQHKSYVESMNLGPAPQSSPEVQIENATFYCKRCGNSFEEFGLLAKHSIDKYGELLGVTCVYCGDSLASNEQLKKHNEDVHNKTNQDNKKRMDFKCTLCQKVIRTNIGIIRHTELFCKQCKKCSPERTSFDLHMGSHQKIRCEDCNLTFSSRLDRGWHIVETH
jgi:hypothetical protein